MAKKFPLNPSHPERLCWGCDQYCAADDLRCGNGSDRTPHPAELFGEDWAAWDLGPPALAEPVTPAAQGGPLPAPAGPGPAGEAGATPPSP